MGQKLIDVSGEVFGRLTVVSRAESVCGGTRWSCRCDCGEVVVVRSGDLRKGRTQSCGCLQRDLTSWSNKTHGDSKTRLYQVWAGIIKRCTNPNHTAFDRYGGRGITVCDRWRKYENFKEDMGQTYKEGLTLDREDNNKGYCKENCRWATIKEQNRNQRTNRMITIDGETRCLAEWCELRNLPYNRVLMRLNRCGWTPERALGFE